MQNKAQILVVDDDPQVLNLLSLLMQKKGFSCACASTGKEALSKIRGSNSIKLVLLDIVLPDTDGDKLLEQIHAISPSLNVIMITGGSDLEIAKKCLEMGAKDYITKPFDLEYLETSVIADIVPLL
ncbi:MAG: response regulator [Patescibacteria group bacterium]|jgi:DNA-binding NtrC family response regulator